MEKTATKNTKADDQKQIDGSSPDELAAKILGLVDEHQNDENFDLETSKFWFQAAYKGELEELFKEKNRLRVLINQFIKRGYKEDEINDLFTKVRRSQLEAQKQTKEGELKSDILKQRIFRLGLAIIVIFIIVQMFFKSNEFALKRENKRIDQAKTMVCDLDKTVFMTKTDFDVEWKTAKALKAELHEGMSIKSESGVHRIKLPEDAVFALTGKTSMSIEKVGLDKDLKNIAQVDFKVDEGIVTWEIKERSNLKINIAFPDGNLSIQYGIGKIDLTSEPGRIVVKDGETTAWVHGGIPKSVNGLMELIIVETPLIRIYDSY